MKSMLRAIMAVAVTFSAPAFAGEEKEKKDEKKGGYIDTFGDMKDEKKKDEKGKYARRTPCVRSDKPT